MIKSLSALDSFDDDDVGAVRDCGVFPGGFGDDGFIQGDSRIGRRNVLPL